MNHDGLRRRSLFAGENKNPTSYVTALIHLIKGNVGPGMLAMGDAFKNGGLVVSLILVIFIAIICVHCEHVLVTCADRMRILYGEKQCTDYAETVELCFTNGPVKTQSWGSKMRITVQVFIVVTQLGFCCVYFVFIPVNMKQVLELHGIHIPLYYLMLMVFLPILLISLITNLKLLMPVSFAANICMILTLTIALYFALKDGLPSVSERNLSTDPLKLALFFGTTIFAFEGIALVLPLRNSMKNPSRFEWICGVLNVGMTIATLMFIAAGSLGYMKWGDEVLGSLTLNLGDSILAQCVKLIAAFGVLLGYPIQFFIPIQIMLPTALRIFRMERRPLLGECIFRTLLVIITLLIAEAIPALELFISLIGSVCSTALALIFPVIIEWILLPIRTTSTFCKRITIIKGIVILIIGILGFALGTYMSIFQIYEHFARGNIYDHEI